MTVAAIKALFDGSAASDADIDDIVTLLGAMTTDQKYQWVIRLHAYLLGAEVRTRVAEKTISFGSDASFKSALGY